MAIPIRSSEEFHQLLEALIDDLVQARIHFRLHQDLMKAVPEYNVEFGQSLTFWSLTFTAHLDAVLLRLCRAYDQWDNSGKPALNLGTLLDLIAENLHLFSETNFRERLKGNKFVDSLAATPRTPDAAQVQDDRDSVSTANPLVKKLTIWRNNFYSHRSVEHVLDPKKLMEKYPLSFGEIETLLKKGLEIADRYSDLFVATFHSTTMVGQSDYLSVLNAVREELRAHNARIEEEMKKLDSQSNHSARAD